jgi:hypothetical protein
MHRRSPAFPHSNKRTKPVLVLMRVRSPSLIRETSAMGETEGTLPTSNATDLRLAQVEVSTGCPATQCSRTCWIIKGEEWTTKVELDLEGTVCPRQRFPARRYRRRS